METTEKPNREAGVHFHSLAEALDDAVICVNTKGEIVYHNAAAAILFGYKPTELLGTRIGLIIAPSDHEALSQAFNKLLADPRQTKRIVLSDGLRNANSSLFFETALTVSTIESDVFLTLIMRDARQRPQPQAEDRAETSYRTLVENMPGASY